MWSSYSAPPLPNVPPPASTAAPLPAGPALPNAVVNPYSQYTAAAMSAMTPEQQMALQAHWQQWQKYQEEYAKWHAQYGEQYNREMAAAASATATAAVTVPIVPTVYPAVYQPQPPPPPPDNKQQVQGPLNSGQQAPIQPPTNITGQPQMYVPPPVVNQVRPPAPLPTTQTNYQQPPYYAPHLTQPPQPNYQMQPQPNFNQPPQPNYNQPPQPNFNQPPQPNFNQPPQPNFNQPPQPNFNQPPQPNFNQPPPNFNPPPQQNSVGPSRSNQNYNAGNEPNLDPNKNQCPENNNQSNFGRFKNQTPDQTNNQAYNFNGPPNQNFNQRQNRNSLPEMPNKFEEDRNNQRNSLGGPPPQFSDQSSNNDKNFVVTNDSGPPNPFNNNRNHFGGPVNQFPSEHNNQQNNFGGPPNQFSGHSSYQDNSFRGPPNQMQDQRGNQRNSFNGPPENFGEQRGNQRDGFAGRPDQFSNQRGNQRNNWNQNPDQRGPNNNLEGNSDSQNSWNRENNSERNQEGKNMPYPENRNNFNTNEGDNDRWGPNNVSRGDNGREFHPNFDRNQNDNRDDQWHGNQRGERFPQHQANLENTFKNNRGNNGNFGSERGVNQNFNQNQVNRPNQGPIQQNQRAPEIDEEGFDRLFRQWEKQFDDWKKANVNHPDREMYNRYEQEFERQRRRLVERRDQMRRRKMEQMGTQEEPPPVIEPDPTLHETKKQAIDETEVKPIENSKSQDDENKVECEQNKPEDGKTEENVNEENKVENVEDNTNSEELSKTLIEDNTESISSKEPRKRKSRFNVPVESKLSKLTDAVQEIISLDEDEDDADKDSKLENITETSDAMSVLFKKSDGIPGLDLVEGDDLSAAQIEDDNKDNSSKTTSSDQESQKNKIPSLFDIVIEKPNRESNIDKFDSKESSTSMEAAVTNALPDIAESLKDPEFMKTITEALAKAQGREQADTNTQPPTNFLQQLPNLLHQFQGFQNKCEKIDDEVNKNLSFSEWQRKKMSGDNDNSGAMDSNMDNMECHNSNSNNDGRHHRLMNNEEDNFGGPGGFNNNSERFGFNMPNPARFGPGDGPNFCGPNNGPNFGGPNGSFGGRFGPNDGPNFGGPNGPFGDRFGPNDRNNFGRHNGPFGGRFGPNDGPNFCGPNGPNNGRFGPNDGPNGGRFGPNDGPNCGRFGPNDGPNSGRFGPNDGPSGGRFGPNDGPNCGRFGPNDGPNGGRFGPNDGRFGPNDGPNGGRFGPNDGPNGGRFGPNDGPNFGGGRFNNDGPCFGGPNGPNGGRFGFNDGPNFNGPNNRFGPNNGPNFGGHNNQNFAPNNDRHNFGDRFGPRGGPNNDGFGRNGPNNSRFSPGMNNSGHGRNRNNQMGGRLHHDDNSNGSHSRNSSEDRIKRGDRSEEKEIDANKNMQGSDNASKTNNPFRRSGGSSETVFDSVDKKSNANSSWVKGSAVNRGHEDFYRPMQVIDYQNTSIAPKIIDYGHRPASSDVQTANVTRDFPDEFMPMKTFDYGHASNANLQNPGTFNRQKQGPQNTNQNRRNRKNKKKNANKNGQNQQKSAENPQHEKSKANENAPVTTTATNEKQSIGDVNKKLVENVQKNINNITVNKEDLEEISDTEDILQNDCDEKDNESTPPPPPPIFSFDEFHDSKHFQNFETPISGSIFPSTATANQNIGQSCAKHLEMSVPTADNQNTINIEDLLLNPGRLLRPKKICIIMRGPPGSGKSHMAKLIKEKENEMGGTNLRILSIDDYFLIENDYTEKCPKTGKSLPKKEILYEYDKEMEETYMQYLIKLFKKTIADNLYDFIIIDCNNNSLRSLNEFYCYSKDSGFMPYIIDLKCDLETCLSRNIHDRTEADIKEVLELWNTTPLHYLKLDYSMLLENLVEMEDAEDMVTEEICGDEEVCNNEDISQEKTENSATTNKEIDQEDSNDTAEDAAQNCAFLKSKWENDTSTENLARLDGTNRLMTKRKTATMEDYLQMDDWEPPKTSTDGKKRVRWADIEEKRAQEKMRAIGFVVGQTDWNRMMDPNAGNRALNRTKYIERVNRQEFRKF